MRLWLHRQTGQFKLLCGFLLSSLFCVHWKWPLLFKATRELFAPTESQIPLNQKGSAIEYAICCVDVCE